MRRLLGRRVASASPGRPRHNEVVRQVTDPPQPHEPRRHEVVVGQGVPGAGAREIIDPFRHGPAHAQVRKGPGRHRDRGEVVHDDAEAQPRRGALDGGAAKVGRPEGVVGQQRQVTLGQDLRFAVR